MSTQARRSRGGCWTCKKAKRKCDRQRPACHACQHRGVVCQGYDLRLRWGTGIASRGHFTGADKPVESSIPPRSKGRRRDLSRERKRALAAPGDSDRGTRNASPLGPMLEDWSPDADMKFVSEFPPQQQDDDSFLFQQFLTTGINVLHATTINQIPLVPAIQNLAQDSKALYQICVALQCYTSPNLQSDFLEHYHDGLKMFRAELSACSTELKDSNLMSGLFLCTIELMRGAPWTVHLEGMYRIQQYHDIQSTNDNNDIRIHLIEVMGVMDMPIFVVGRQTPYFAVWHRHRSSTMLDNMGCVEAVSGLPYSLLDLFAGIGEYTTDLDLWNWPGENGSLLQCQLWEAHRLAGMLSVRRFQRRTGKILSNHQQNLPVKEILVLRILSCIEAIITAYSTSERSGLLVINAINYPVFTAGLEVEVLRQNPEYKLLIRKFFQVSESGDFGVVNQTLQSLLDDLWDIDELDLDINDLARSRGIETALF